MSADLYPGTLCDLMPRPHVMSSAHGDASHRAPMPVCSKTAYSKREAETVRNARLRSHHSRPEHLRIYACARCGAWHLTHHEDDAAE